MFTQSPLSKAIMAHVKTKIAVAETKYNEALVRHQTTYLNDIATAEQVRKQNEEESLHTAIDSVISSLK